MDYFVGLDVGAEDTALCVMEVEGGAVLQTGVPTDPQAVAQAIKPYAEPYAARAIFSTSSLPRFDPPPDRR